MDQILELEDIDLYPAGKAIDSDEPNIDTALGDSQKSGEDFRFQTMKTITERSSEHDASTAFQTTIGGGDLQFQTSSDDPTSLLK